MARRRDRKKRKGKLKGKPKKRAQQRGPAVEWIGGIRASPMIIAEEGRTPYAPAMGVWVQKPPGTILAMELERPEIGDGLFGASLRVAQQRSTRPPSRIRVESEALAERVRAELGAATRIVVAPTPEIDHVISELARAQGGPVSYLSGDGMTPVLVERFFRAAEVLWRLAPWRYANDGQLVRVDAPELSVEGACVSILGAAGMEHGFALFASAEDYDAFIEVASSGAGRPAPGVSELLLSYDERRDLDPAVVREVERHGWPLASKRAYPSVLSLGPGAAVRPATAEELRLMTAIAAALGPFVAQNRRLFEEGGGSPASATYELDDGPAVTLTAPDDAFEFFHEAHEPPLATPSFDPPKQKVGRNDPCPCGSGKKYKKCCLGQETARADGAHDVDQRLVAEILGFAMHRFGPVPFDRRMDDVGAGGQQLAMPWFAYVAELDGATLAELFAAEHELSSAERAYLDAQRASWVSVWEIVDFVAGESLTLVDLLSGEQRTVHEVSGSRGVSRRLTLLGRIVDLEGRSILCGSHVRALPPGAAARVVERARKYLRRKRDIAVERLRGEKVARYLLRRWNEEVDELDAEIAIPPKLVNTEGHELLVTIDHFRFEPVAHDWLLERLERLAPIDIERVSSCEAHATLFMDGNPAVESLDNTVIGRMKIDRGKLQLESNSRERADALRARLMQACGDLLRAHGRTHSDPMAHMSAAAEAPPAMPLPDEMLPDEMPPEALAAVAELKAKHYATWADTPIPALGGDTPREHCRTAAGKRVVDVLLKDAELLEQRSSVPFDFSVIRADLGLDR